MGVGVDEEVAENVAESLRVDEDGGVAAFHGDFQSHDLEIPRRRLDLLEDRYPLGHQFELPGFEPGGYRQVVDDPRQLDRLADDGLDRFGVVSPTTVGSISCEADDPGQRAAQVRLSRATKSPL